MLTKFRFEMHVLIEIPVQCVLDLQVPRRDEEVLRSIFGEVAMGDEA